VKLEEVQLLDQRVYKDNQVLLVSAEILALMAFLAPKVIVDYLV
jgi:hypothetical protein